MGGAEAGAQLLGKELIPTATALIRPGLGEALNAADRLDRRGLIALSHMISLALWPRPSRSQPARNIGWKVVLNNLCAYGFRLICPQAGSPLRDLCPCEMGAPKVLFRWRVASSIIDHEHVDEQRVAYGVRGAASMLVERDPPSVLFDLTEEPIPDAVIHPLGTIPLAILARWRGDVTLHAGGFATRVGAWGLLGEREAGKSTMLAALAQHDVPLLSDDLLAILDGEVWPGPSCVDLRPDVAERFPRAQNLGIVGGRRRFRLVTPPAERRLPLRGIFVLAWHDGPGITVEEVTTEERLRLLYSAEYVALVGPADPQKILQLLHVPVWRIARPRTWEATDQAVEAILDIARG